uniref:Large ribosomal subunit protein mL43 n=1 Tax=Plectus sambesii TaxID=2011161 RepID=A0A914WAB3_9BILA
MPARARVDRIKVLYNAAKSLPYPWLLRDYPKTVLHNGVGRFVCQLQRLTFTFCKSTEPSFGVRQFIEHDLLDFARENPVVVVYVQPVRHKLPMLVGEYLNGRTASTLVKNMDRDEVARHVNYLRTRSGQRIVQFERDEATNNPSVQGMWHPMLHQDTAMNSAALPDATFSKHHSSKQSATERVLQMLEEARVTNVQLVDDGSPI